MFRRACCFQATVSFSLNRLHTRRDSGSELSLLSSFHPFMVSFSISSRPVMEMILGQCGMQTPLGAQTTTGHLTRREPRLKRVLQTPGALCHRAIHRPTKAQVRFTPKNRVGSYFLVGAALTYIKASPFMKIHFHYCCHTLEFSVFLSPYPMCTCVFFG